MKKILNLNNLILCLCCVKMFKMLLFLVILAIFTPHIITCARIRRADKLDLGPTSLGNRLSTNSCTYNGKTGKCVQESYCSSEHVILKGGDIDESELRQKSLGCRSDLFQWCCSEQIVTEPSPNNVALTGCTASEDDTCPWCVGLYTNPSPFTSSSGLYCMGSIIGTNVVLTAGTCIISVENRNLYARVPDSLDPKQNYKVLFRKYHPEYNSGTRVNDFGLLFLEKEVVWKDSKWKGACLSFQPMSPGECYAMGFDNNDNIVSSILTIQNGKCRGHGGDAPEVACGTVFEGDACSVVTGSPILCKQGKMVVSGVARSSCFSDDTALLGSLSSYEGWLKKELENVKLTNAHFTLNGA